MTVDKRNPDAHADATTRSRSDKRRERRPSFILFLWIVIMWQLLWGEVTWANIFGGIGVALAESVISSQRLGAHVTLAGEPALLFSETQSRFIVSVKKDHQEAFEKLVKDADLIGEVTSDSVLAVQSQEGQQWIHAQTEELESAWKGAIPCLLKSKA